MSGISGSSSETSNELLKREIEGMQLRKQTLLSSLQTDVLEIEQQKDVLSIQIGYAVYSAHKENKDEPNIIQTAFLTNLYSQMDELDGKVMEIKAKMNEISARYDDEIDILSKSLSALPQTVSPPVAQPISQPVSPQSASSPVAQPISQPVVQQMPQPAVQLEPAPVLPSMPSISQPGMSVQEPDVASGATMFCSECGTKYTEGYNIFCENCGVRLE